MRCAEIKRETRETKIELRLELDGSGKGDIKTGCGFLDHMLELMTFHGQFDLFLRCLGDVDVDYHHTAEDIAIVLGQAVSGTRFTSRFQAIRVFCDAYGRGARDLGLGYIFACFRQLRSKDTQRKDRRFRRRARKRILLGLCQEPWCFHTYYKTVR